MAKAQTHTLLATLLVLLALLVPIGVGAAIVYYVVNKPEVEVRRVALEALTPTTIHEGETFELKVLIHNHTDQPVNLRGIDLAVSYLDGFVVFGSTPDFDEDESGLVFRRFDYNLPIAPGENQQVVFRIQAVNTGIWSGDLDARISGTSGTITKPLQTTVTLPGSGAIGDEPPIDDGPPLQLETPED